MQVYPVHVKALPSPSHKYPSGARSGIMPNKRGKHGRCPILEHIGRDRYQGCKSSSWRDLRSAVISRTNQIRRGCCRCTKQRPSETCSFDGSKLPCISDGRKCVRWFSNVGNGRGVDARNIERMNTYQPPEQNRLFLFIVRCLISVVQFTCDRSFYFCFVHA